MTRRKAGLFFGVGGVVTHLAAPPQIPSRSGGLPIENVIATQNDRASGVFMRLA
jgi:hypothetical protein